LQNSQISNFAKIRTVGVEIVPCGRTDGQRDMTKLVGPFRNFANALKTEQKLVIHK